MVESAKIGINNPHDAISTEYENYPSLYKNIYRGIQFFWFKSTNSMMRIDQK